MSEFEERFERIRLSLIEDIQQIDEAANPRYEGQPEYIRIGDVLSGGKSSETAFLGMNQAQVKECKNLYYAPHQMVIPRYFRMVKIGELSTILWPDGRDTDPDVNNPDPIPINERYYYAGRLAENMIMDVGTTLSKTDDSPLFHICHTYQGISNGQVCHNPVTTMKTPNSETPYDLILFFLQNGDIKVGDDWDISKGRHPHADTGRKIIDRIAGLENMGYFFIPLLQSDQSIVYYCFPNGKDVKNGGKLVRNTLREWISNVQSYNPATQDLLLATYDKEIPPIDRWSISLSRSTSIMLKDK